MQRCIAANNVNLGPVQFTIITILYIYRAITRHHIYIISLVNRKGQDFLVTLDVVIQFLCPSQKIINRGQFSSTALVILLILAQS